jgi:hypothetical protein
MEHCGHLPDSTMRTLSGNHGCTSCPGSRRERRMWECRECFSPCVVMNGMDLDSLNRLVQYDPGR